MPEKITTSKETPKKDPSKESKSSGAGKLFQEKFLSFGLKKYEDFYGLPFADKEKVIQALGLTRIQYNNKDSFDAYNKEWESIAQLYGYKDDTNIEFYPNVLSVNDKSIIDGMNKVQDSDAMYSSKEENIGDQIIKAKSLGLNDYPDFFAMNRKQKEEFMVKMNWYPKKNIMDKMVGNDAFKEQAIDKNYIQNMTFFMRKASEAIPQETITSKKYDNLGSVYEKGSWIVSNTDYFKLSGEHIYMSPEGVTSHDVSRYEFIRNLVDKTCFSEIIQSLPVKDLSVDEKIDLFRTIDNPNFSIKDLDPYLVSFKASLDGIDSYYKENQLTKSFKDKLKKELLLEDSGKYEALEQKYKKTLNDIIENSANYRSFLNEQENVVEGFSSHIYDKIKKNRDILELLDETKITFDFASDVPETIINSLKRMSEIESLIVNEFKKVLFLKEHQDNPDAVWKYLKFERSIHVKLEGNLNKKIIRRIKEKFELE